MLVMYSVRSLSNILFHYSFVAIILLFIFSNSFFFLLHLLLRLLFLSSLSGKFNNISGANKCKACVANTYAAVARRTSCIGCPLGWSSEASSTKCQSCEAGTFSNVQGKACDNCGAGQYRTNNQDSTSCVPCSVGTYQEEEGAASCLPCIP